MDKRTPLEKVLHALNYAVVTAVSLMCLYPMLHVLFASLSDPMRLLAHRGLLLWPQGFSLKGYQAVLSNPNILSGYMNTIIYLAGGLVVSMVLTPLGAYALACKDYPFRNVLVFLFVFTMYFSGGLIPNFLVIKNLGLYDSRWAIILPTAVSTYNLIVMRTAFSSVPGALQESACLDGANDFVILYRIYIPCIRATMAVVCLFYAVSQWNSWFNSMIYLQSSSKWPLQLWLREILINSASGGTSDDADALYLQELIRYAVIVVATVPILVVYPYAQKYFMKGVMLGSVKG